MTPHWKTFKEDPRSRWGCASKAWSFSSSCKNLGAQHLLGAEIWSLKSRFVRVRFHHYISVISGPKFTDFLRPTREESRHKMYSSDFYYLHPFRVYSPPYSEVVRNWARFCTFLATKIFWGMAPKFWTGIIKFGLLLITAQNFTPIGRRTSEISRWNERKHLR